MEIYHSRKWSFDSPPEQAFEQAFAAAHDAKHGILMANGTVTLQAALIALGVGEGDEVIVPALTWIATAMAARYVGATPVFADMNPNTLCLDPASVAAALSQRTKAIIPVHLYGSMADLDAIRELAGECGAAVIEDCAHMHGGKWRGRGVGTWGRIGSFSFQESKTMSSGEGGICITNDDELADRLFRIKHIGYGRGTSQGGARTGPPTGLQCHNFRATAFQAAILSDQLEDLPQRLERYQKTADVIRARLADVPGVRVQSPGAEAGPQGFYTLPLLFDDPSWRKVTGGRLREIIVAEGLSLAASYGPVYRHKLFNLQPDQYGMVAGGCPIAEELGSERTVCLPHPWLDADEEDIKTVTTIVEKVARLGGEAFRGE